MYMYTCTCTCTVCGVNYCCCVRVHNNIQYASKKRFQKRSVPFCKTVFYHAVWLPFLTVVPFGFKAVSFRAISCCSIDAESNCREVKNREAKIASVPGLPRTRTHKLKKQRKSGEGLGSNIMCHRRRVDVGSGSVWPLMNSKYAMEQNGTAKKREEKWNGTERDGTDNKMERNGNGAFLTPTVLYSDFSCLDNLS